MVRPPRRPVSETAAAWASPSLFHANSSAALTAMNSYVTPFTACNLRSKTHGFSSERPLGRRVLVQVIIREWVVSHNGGTSRPPHLAAWSHFCHSIHGLSAVLLAPSRRGRDEVFAKIWAAFRPQNCLQAHTEKRGQWTRPSAPNHHGPQGCLFLLRLHELHSRLVTRRRRPHVVVVLSPLDISQVPS